MKKKKKNVKFTTGNKKKCARYGKTKYDDEAQAKLGLGWIWSHDPSVRLDGDLHTYQCEFCGYWHIGHWSKYQGEEQNG